MQSISIEATMREAGKNKSRKLKKEGYILAVLYGKGMESIPLAVEDNKLQRLIQKHGRNVLLDIVVNGSTHNAIIKEIQEDTVKGKIIHVDFQRVSMYEMIESTVPIKVEGEGLIESKGGILQHQLWELNIKSLPSNIPQEVVIDISNLNIGDTLFVKDIKLPDGVEKLDDEEEVVLSILAPKTSEVEETEESVEESEE